MCESPLRGHICNSLPVISPLLIKIGELKSLGTGFLSELNVLNVNWPVVKLSLWHFTVLQATLHIAGACGLGQVVKARVERSIAADGRGRDNYVVVTTNTAGNGPTFPWRISGLGVHKHWWKCPQVTLKISSFGQHKHSWRQPDFTRKISSFGCCKFQGQRKNIQWCLAYKHWNAHPEVSVSILQSPGGLNDECTEFVAGGPLHQLLVALIRGLGCVRLGSAHKSDIWQRWNMLTNELIKVDRWQVYLRDGPNSWQEQFLQKCTLETTDSCFNWSHV